MRWVSPLLGRTTMNAEEASPNTCGLTAIADRSLKHYYTGYCIITNKLQTNEHYTTNNNASCMRPLPALRGLPGTSAVRAESRALQQLWNQLLQNHPQGTRFCRFDFDRRVTWLAGVHFCFCCWLVL